MKFNIEISVPNNGRCRENSRWDGIVLNGSGDVQISNSDGANWVIQKNITTMTIISSTTFRFGSLEIY